jgi:hypothetical protein
MKNPNWYELIPVPTAAVPTDDQASFLRRARRAAEALGLSSRPSLDSAGDLLRRADGVTLLAEGPRRYVALDPDASDDAAAMLARACDATAKPCERPAILDERLVWAHAVVPSLSTLGRTAQDDLETGDDVRLAPSDGSLVYVHVRRQGFMEVHRAKRWLADEFNMQPDTSKLVQAGTGVARVGCAAPDRGAALKGAERAANSLDLGLTPGVSKHISRPALGLLCLSLVPLIASIALTIWLQWPLLVPFAVILFAFALVRYLRTPKSADLRQRPRHYWSLSDRMRKAKSDDLKTRSTGDEEGAGARKRRVHAYSYQRSTLPVPAATLAALARPAPAVEGSRTALTEAPESLLKAQGPRVGVDAGRRDVRLAANTLYGGVFLMGRMGGGKSNSMHGLERWAAEHDAPGDAMVVFESKGVDSVPLLRSLMGGLHVVDVNDPATPMIDLLGSGSPSERAERFASLMRGALGDGQIGPRSRMQLRDAVWLALDVLPLDSFAKSCAAAGASVPKSWVAFAMDILAGSGVAQARALAHAARMADDGPEVAQAVERLHGGVNESSGRPLVSDGQLISTLSAPMNKMSLLSQAPAIAAPGRRSFAWRSMLKGSAHAPARLVVNLGGTVGGAHESLPEDVKRLVGALLLQGLRQEIEAGCAGWQAQGRHMRLFADELTELLGSDAGTAGGNAEAFGWMHSKGRAYGAELTAGTQFPEQLDHVTLALVSGFDAKLCFAMRASDQARVAGDMMGVEPERLQQLPLHVAAVRAVDGDFALLPAMFLAVPHFDGGDAA